MFHYVIRHWIGYNSKMRQQRSDSNGLPITGASAQEARPARGKLKIFLGMAAGVGKTYAMLLAAQERVAEGVDVVVGYVETHGRPETAALLTLLESVPRQHLAYHGTVLEEMDLDAILARRPQLVLVDEFAHTNAATPTDLPRHRKRYQDVIELLDAGIDVYTTVNVQHFASRADAVRQITGVPVTETVPDSLLDLADAIELVDLSPDELRKRLAEGKVYTGEEAAVAADNFFRTGNLTALREMALRLTAEHVDHQLQDYMQAKQITGPWKSRERLMVAVGASPYSEQLIRWTRRMAYALEAPWFAATVETTRPLAPEAQRLLAHNLALARELGGEVISTAGDAVETALLQLAQQHNVTQIIIGKPLYTPLQALLRGGSLVDKLIRNSGNIDIHVVTGEEAKRTRLRRLWPWQTARASTWRAYALALVVMAAVTAGNWLALQLVPWVEYQVVGLTDLLTVLLIAIYIGRGPALLAATVSAVSFNFFFIEPHYTFAIRRFQDIVLICLYFVIAIFAGNLTARIRQQEQLAQRNIQRILSLYRLARETATAADLDAVLRTAVDQLQHSFQADVAILLAADGQLARAPHPSSTLMLDDKAFSVALWAFDHGRPAGRFTDTLPLAHAHFVPLRTPHRITGVIGLQMQQERQLTFEQELQLETFVNQIALVVERQQLDHAARQSALLQESERLHTTLLNSISHELRTPLATITGAADILANPATRADGPTRQALLTDVHDAAQRLNHLVENLLDMSRLDAGRLQIKRDWCVVSDVVGVAVQRLHSCLAQRPLTLAIPPDLPLVQMDFVLMEQVLINLLHNICNYTPPGTPVAIQAQIKDGWLWLTVADRGPGIPPELVERIFDKFYRVPGTATGGTGLGLSICRGLVHAHGGELLAANRAEGGAQFTIQLPAATAPPPVKEAEIE
ncbi:MAG: sensor histidine kinase KdpD [Caldilineaceae bacterium]